jgi:uncharacterized protein
MKAEAHIDVTRTARATGASPRAMSMRTLIAFLAIAFGLSWGLMGLYMAFPDQITAVFGEVGYTNPLFILAVYAPAIAGIFLVWRTYGLRGLASYFRRLTLWRMPLAGWLFVLLGIPAVNYLGAAISGAIAAPFPFSPWYMVFPALLAGLLIGPMEEFGWRGVALPLFQRRFSPLVASLILGIIWGLWHVPSFFMEGTPQSAWAFGPYFVGVVAIAVILTSLFNASKGSLLIAALYHFQMNNPIWPDAQPWGSYIFAAVALVVVVLNRKALLSRDNVVTGVLYGGVAR